MLADEVQEHCRVTGLTDDAVAGLREQTGEPFPEQEIVVSDDDRAPDPGDGLFVHGSSMRKFGAAANFRLLSLSAISSASSGGYARLAG
jgi:hypothetical protein